MVRRKGRPRRAAEAPKQGPDRKSLVKYVECWKGHLASVSKGPEHVSHVFTVPQNSEHIR